MLPLKIDPQPIDVKRVFVGRLEIATAETLREVRSAVQKNDRAKLAQYGRFLDPIGRQVRERVAGAGRGSIAMSSLPDPMAG